MATDAAAVLDSLTVNPLLRGFVRGHLIERMPAKRSRRRLLLAEVAQIFEPGHRYSEPAVNDLHRRPRSAAIRSC